MVGETAAPFERCSSKHEEISLAEDTFNPSPFGTGDRPRVGFGVGQSAGQGAASLDEPRIRTNTGHGFS